MYSATSSISSCVRKLLCTAISAFLFWKTLISKVQRVEGQELTVRSGSLRARTTSRLLRVGGGTSASATQRCSLCHSWASLQTRWRLGGLIMIASEKRKKKASRRETRPTAMGSGWRRRLRSVRVTHFSSHAPQRRLFFELAFPNREPVIPRPARVRDKCKQEKW